MSKKKSKTAKEAEAENEEMKIVETKAVETGAEEKEARRSFSLFELTQHLRRVVSFNMRDYLWIRAEVADVSFSKGNYYVNLVERDAYQVKARAEAAAWATVVNKLREKFKPTRPSQVFAMGQQLLLQVEATYHEYYGFKLVIHDVDLAYTIGELEQQRQQTWVRVQAEGLDKLNKALPMPILPQRIAVISSSQAAGYADFMEQLHKNPHGYAFETTLFDNAMQGPSVEKDLRGNMLKLAAYAKDFDVAVIVRGGGSKLDLAWFDSYEVCLAAAKCPLPLLTGIGHEIDESLTDKVAFEALKTPTAVAEALINRFLQADKKLAELAARVETKKTSYVQAKMQQLERLEQRAAQAQQANLQRKTFDLQQLEQRFSYAQPRNTLERGFVVAFDANKQRITHASQLKEGQELTLLFQDGRQTVVVVGSK
jgi:exodeoxyribonuclease VII large subunit